MKNPNEIRKEQAAFSRQQMTADERQSQAAADRAEIKVKLIENGVLIKAGADGWFSFPGEPGNAAAGWPAASQHIFARLEALERQRRGGA